jgi:formylglycine-generating enzyme required for sulfatase activity
VPRVGEYELEGAIGRGGMGVVHRARTSRGELVAVKLLARADPASVARFDREVRLLRELGETHGFVPIIDDGTSERSRYLVMPLLGGGTLRERLQRGPLRPEAVRLLGAALARALAAAHERGIVHRDVKPENVLFTATGAPLLADLGLAKHFSTREGSLSSVALSRAGELRGTVGYLAPEQIADARSVDDRADIFALGAVLYEAVAGVPAFAGETAFEVLGRIASGRFEPLPASVPRDLARVVESCLAAKPDDRPRDLRALARALEGEATLVVGRRSRTWPRLAAGGVVGGAALVAVVLATQGAAPPPLAPRAAALPAPAPGLVGSGPAPVATAELLARAPAWYRALPEAERPRLPLREGLELGGSGEYVNMADGSVLVYVPAGEFLMGPGPDDADVAAFADARPAHTVRLSAYFIGKYEVSNAQWRRHGVSPTQAEVDGGYVGTETELAQSPRRVPGASWRTPQGDGVPCVDSHPVVQVLWAEALAYARSVGLRLATEAEWERAAGWDGKRSHRYPWGRDEPPDATHANVRAYDMQAVAGPRLDAVTSHPAGVSPVGAFNMCGNAAEFVLDVYDLRSYEAYAGRTALDPCVFDERKRHVVRGGSFEEIADMAATHYRSVRSADECANTTGFRVALSEDGSPRPRPR